MSGRVQFQAYEREQMLLLPQDMREWLPEPAQLDSTSRNHCAIRSVASADSGNQRSIGTKP